MIRGNEKFLTQLYVLVDVVFIFIAFSLAWWLKFGFLHSSTIPHLPFHSYLIWGVIYALLSIFLGYFFNLYAPKRKNPFKSELIKIVEIHIFSLLILISILFLFGVENVSRGFLISFFGTSILSVGFYRLLVKLTLRSLRKKGYNKQFVVILGAGTIGRQYHDMIKRHPEFGIEVLGFLDDFQNNHIHEFGDYTPIIGKVNDLGYILDKHTVDEIVIALPFSAHKKYQEIVGTCEKAGVRVLIIPDYHKILPAKPSFDTLGDLPVINIREVPLDELRNRILKRAFDIVFSIFAILLTLPIMILISIMIKLTSEGPIIFKQERVGMNNRTFIMYKFRSMKIDSNGESKTKWTTPNDNRRTLIGTLIRQTSLDELPQFFNVLKGDMSVVGPRPERPYFVNQFKENVPKYMVKHYVRPGITGWAQVNGLRGDTSISKRITFDLFYIENWTFVLDLKIICKTLVSGFLNKNAY